MHIVDVTCPYEDGWHSIAEARQKKIEKYGPMKDFLSSAGFRVTLDAFVVGALGT